MNYQEQRVISGRNGMGIDASFTATRSHAVDDGALSEEEDTKGIMTEASQLLGSESTPDDLHLRFAKILGSSAVGDQTILNIPKDFAMRYNHPSGPHAIQLALCEQLQKKRQLNRRRNPLSKPSARLRNQPHFAKPGFDPEQLLKKRALHLAKGSSSQASSLTCAIHPIFRAENFHGCSDSLYEQFKPALRLATMMLTHRACSQYWYSVWFGRRQLCEDTSRAKQKACFRIKEDVAWSSERARGFSSVLLQHAERIHFYFHSSPLSSSHAQASFQWVEDTKNLLPLHRPHDYETFIRGRICLHTDFYTVAKRNSLLSHPEPAAILRYHFWLATCLMHEVAHYLEWARRSTLPNHIHEVFWYEDDWNEAGEAWEKKFFGGRIEPIASRADCIYGLATVNWPMAPITEVEGPDQKVFWALPMEYISTIQQQKTWDLLDAKESPEKDPTTFHVPRIGSRSQHLSGLDMTIREDEAAQNLISDDLDGVDTILKRTSNGRIVKRTRDKRRVGVLVKSKRTPKKQKKAADTPTVDRSVRHHSVRGKMALRPRRTARSSESEDKGANKGNGEQAGLDVDMSL